MAGMRRDANGFTPMQAAIMEVLGDGEWHSRAEIERLLDDDRHVVRNHIRNLRPMLSSKGYLLGYYPGPFGETGLQLTRKLSSVRDGGG